LNGSVAAPTAGLHFTESVLDELENKKIEKLELTLHVGAGTFKPVTEELISNHEMHSERFYIGINQIQKLIEKRSSIIAVGTTSVRTLESLYWLGVKISQGKVLSNKDIYVDQWEPYELQPNISVKDALSHILTYLNNNHVQILEGITRIIIVPGYKFNLVKGLITNYHMPRSTLLLLIAAFIGSDWKKVYAFALKNNFRFLSYGDSSLLLP
jgi:S-adenosylmethionine:tRNA ribosyltransferase-isomerase